MTLRQGIYSDDPETIAASQAAAEESEFWAGIAAGLVGPIYTSTIEGLAATVSGDEFLVDNGNDTATVYLNNAGVAVERRTIIIDPTNSASSGLLGHTATGTGAVGTVGAKLRETISVKDHPFLAAGDGVTDDTAAIQAAIDAANAVYIPSGTYRCASGITIPGGVKVFGSGGLAATTSAGSILLFDTSVATLVSLGDNADAGNGLAGDIADLCVVRADGLVPAGSIGINVQRLNNAKLIGVKSENSAINYRLKAADTRGLGFKGFGMVSARAHDVDIEIDGWPEARFTLCRFGQNGVEEDSTAYVRIKGGSTINAAGGPNTIVFTNCQFNKGDSKKVDHIVRFEDFTPSYISDVGVFKFNACHIESFLAGVYTDDTITPLQRLTFTDTHFNSAVEFWDLHANTTVFSVGMSNCFVAGTFTLAQTAQISAIQITGNRFSGNVSYTSGAGGNSTLVSAGNTYVSNLTLAGTWEHLKVDDVLLGTLANSANGNWSVCIPGVDQRSWTPSITFGGGSTGIAYSANRAGVISKIGDEVFAQFEIELTNKGSSTGNALITGLPVAVRGGANLTSSNGSGGVVNYAINMTGLTGAVSARTPSGASVDLYQWGATGMARVTDANFTNTSRIAGTIRYRGA